MPRLTNKTYLKQRTRIRHLWFDLDGFAIAQLSPREQMDLHAFYAPTEPYDDAQALKYRKEARREQSELPQRAGRAYARLLIVERALLERRHNPPVVAPAGKRTNRRRKDLVIRVNGLVRPTPDYDGLARALLWQADVDIARERDVKDQE